MTFETMQDSAPPAPPQARADWRRDRRVQIGAGVAVAALLGMGLAVWAGGGDSYRAEAPASTDPSERMQVVLDPSRAPPAPQPVSAGKLEVLPTDMAAAPARVAAPDPGPDQPSPVRYAEAPPTPAVPAERYEVPVSVTVPPPVRRVQARPSFDCRYARSQAEEMVCEDPDLAAADRRLARAYDRAARYGSVPPRDLRAEQDDWLEIREDAARRSPAAVSQVYDQRIQELDALAEP